METRETFPGLELMTSTIGEKGEQEPTYNKKSSNFLDYTHFSSYHDRFQQERRDILKFIPATTLHTFPVQGHEWLYGWTVRGTSTVNIRDDLSGLKRLETDIHESTHTPDEYETRRRTECRMEWLFPKEEKYRMKPKEYQV